MSRIGKKPIKIISGVNVRVESNRIFVRGPKGELERDIRPEISIEVNDEEIIVKPFKETKRTKSFWGLSRTLISNMIEGVVNGYETKLQIEGIGYRANLEGNDLNLQLGFSHPVKVSPTKGVFFSVEKNIISVSGIDKEAVTQMAAKIRKIKPPEPYKGKGIRYQGEIVKKKIGKKAASSGVK
jgi:large subunit ribosomal protein L6